MLTALIVLAVVAPVAVPCQPRVAAATVHLASADAAAGRRDYRVAGSAIDAGLRDLGSGYARPPTIDDTGMHLVMAEAQNRRGKVKLAVELKRRILVERLALCRQQVR